MKLNKELEQLLQIERTQLSNGVEKTKVLDVLDNYITYFSKSDKYMNKFSSKQLKRGNKILIIYLFDNVQFVINNKDNVFINARNDINKDIGLNKVSYIKDAITHCCNDNIINDVDDVDDNMIATSYESEYDEINSLLDEIVNDDTIQDKSDWDLYIEWCKKESIKNYNKDGEVTGTSDCYDNIIGWLEHFPLTKNKIKYNDKSSRIDFNGKIYDDNTVHTIMTYLNKYFIRKYSNVKGLNEAIKGCANKHHYNPVKEYIETLKYDDSRDWFEYLLKDVLKADNWSEFSELYIAEFRKWMCACIKRIYEPGCKFDNILVLVSKCQGTGKSSIWEQLFNINNESFCKIVDASQEIPNGDRFIQQCAGKVCVNFDEIAMKAKNVNKIKTMLTETVDEWHTLYSVADAPRPRDYLFVGTTNNDDFLKDYTSMYERRWWIIKLSENSKNGIYVNTIFNDKELNLRDKIWAQAKYIYDNNLENDLYITQDSELGGLLEVLQRGYKASNNEYYAEIVNIMQMDWGFFDDKKFVNVDSLVKQYKSGDSIKYCENRNVEIDELSHKDGYIMKSDDIKYTCYGQIDKWPAVLLQELLDKLGIKYTKQSLKNELEYANEFEYKVSRSPMTSKVAWSWCRNEDTPINKFKSQIEEEIINEGEGTNELPF